uniref:cyclin-dependent kinase n=1 Tax=Periophthalmus magnuspinnatus TaxID=409849 RepID=A0A3B3ZS62_9GOBI
MGDEKDSWKVKTLDEILQEKKRRRELKNADERESKRDTPEEGELRDQRMEITIRNSPYTREDSTEDRSLFKDRKDKRRHRSHSAEEGQTGRFKLFTCSNTFVDGLCASSAKHVRPKEKEKDRESDRRKRHWEEDKLRLRNVNVSLCVHSDRLEQLERQRERDRKLREQQKEQRELKEQREFKERERRVEERLVQTHHRAPAEEYEDKLKPRQRSRSPTWAPRDRAEHNEPRKTTELKEDKPELKDLLADLQDISDNERKTTSAESSIASGSGSEEEDDDEEEDDSSSQSEAEGEGEEESASGSARSEQSAEEVSEDEQSEDESEEERENGNHIPPEEEEDGREGNPTPQSQTHSHSATPEENYIPDSPPLSPVELKKELPKYLPALQGCRSVEEFQCLNRIEEGTYGVVYRAKDKKTDEIVALKRLKMEKEKEGFPITSLREINTILKAQHQNIVTVREIVVGSNMDKIYIVMNYVEHDLKSLMETMKQPFLPGEVKTLMIQLLRGVRHLHDNWILHRDLKTSNLLLSHKGILKIGDFGLAREYGSPLKPYTPVVVTLWYRSPDLLLGAKEYSTAVDMWSVGCIFGELLTQKPLFPGKSEIDQINKIFKDLGSPSEKIWPGYNELPAVKKMSFTEYPYNNLRKRFGALLSDQGFDLMNKFLTYCPAKRITSDEALKHEYFRETPLPIDPSMFPTWPAKSEQQRVKRGTSPRPPEGGLGYSQLGDDDLKDTGFHLTTSNQGASAVGPGFSLKF